MKKRKEKEKLYEQKYSHIPLDYQERLAWMCEHYKVNMKKMDEIVKKKNAMEMSLYYTEFKIVLYEEPEGSPRPRFRLINRYNAGNMAMSNGNFVHVYSVNAREDSVFMKRLLGNELQEYNQMIYTPCILECATFHKTPSNFNTTDTFLAEIGLERPITKPDWDNIGKKYSDMFNSNIWLDDTLVIRGTVDRYYSILPRVEITVKYLNMLYNKNQYKSMINKITDPNVNIDYFRG